MTQDDAWLEAAAILNEESDKGQLSSGAEEVDLLRLPLPPHSYIVT